MVIGGLGNQMFQYAAGRALALRHGTELMLDLSAFRRPDQFGIMRPFELDKLAIRARDPSPLSPLSFLLARRSVRAVRALSGWKIERELSFNYNPRFPGFPDGTYLVGYWQSWRYFESPAARIHAELQPRSRLSALSLRLRDRMCGFPSLAVHVRRGDYLSRPQVTEFHGILGLDYYRQALRHVQDRVPDLRAFVFSDDLEWCREAFAPLGLDMTLVDGNQGADSWQDIHLMAACRHAIIANSSFSWWGAWLGDHSGAAADRIVIAPQRWFAAGHVPVDDRFPPGWTTL
jgi:hypothetical protein